MVVRVIGWKLGGYFLVGEVAFWVWVFCWWLGLSVMMAPFLRCTRNGKGDGWLVLLLSGTEQKWENHGTEFLTSNALTASGHRQNKSQFGRWSRPGSRPGSRLVVPRGSTLWAP